MHALLLILLSLVYLGGAGIYFYTIYLAYILSGLIPAALSAMFPPLSQIYWMYERWSVTGDIYNFYTQICLAYLVAVGILMVGFLFFGEKEKSD